MLSFEEARANLLTALSCSLSVERVSLVAAPGRVLADNVVSPMDVPPADNSAMDGYALRVADAVSALPVSQRIPAGSLALPLAAGTAARIFTGAPVPPGADAVVMQEHCDTLGDSVRVQTLPRAGDNIRRRGEDIAAGAIVLSAGQLLDAAALGLAASVGVAELAVFRRLRVAMFFTGNELQAPGETLAPGRIYNSNRYVLGSLLAMLGCELVDLGIVPDSLEATRAALREAARSSDLVMTCGGVSVGEEDHVKAAVEAEGRLQHWRVAIRPGKPLALGEVAGRPFIGLPGNPVSAFVTLQTVVRPALRRMQGLTEVLPQTRSLRADFDWDKRLPVTEFLRVRRNAEGGLDRFANQGSGVLSSCVWADGLVMNPPQTPIRRGDIVSYLSFAELP